MTVEHWPTLTFVNTPAIAVINDNCGKKNAVIYTTKGNISCQFSEFQFASFWGKSKDGQLAFVGNFYQSNLVSTSFGARDEKKTDKIS